MPIKILPYPQKFSIPTSLLIFISTKLLTCPWNKFTHANEISHMHHEYVHTRSQHRFFTMPMLPKSKPKFIQQHHKLPTLSKFHKPPILSKLHHDKKINTSKMLQSQHYNMTNYTMPQISTRTHNKMTMAHHQTFNEAWNNIFPSQEIKEKLTLMSTWEYGAWALGSWRRPSSSYQSNARSYFLPWKVRKEDPLEEEDILVQREMGLKMGFTKNWCVAKVLKTQGSKEILREMDKGSLRSLEKFFFFFFFFF